MIGSAHLIATAPNTPKPPRAPRVSLWLSVLAVGTTVALWLPTPVGAQGGGPTVCTRIQWMVEQPEAAVRQGLNELPSMMAVLGMTPLWVEGRERYETEFLARARELTAAAILALQEDAPPIGENALGLPPHLPRSLPDILLEELQAAGAPATEASTQSPQGTGTAMAAALRACGLSPIS
jgi:hypothetical protein